VWECSTTKKKTLYADVVWPDPLVECGPDLYYVGKRGVAGCPKIGVTKNTTQNLKLNDSTVVWFDSTNKIVWTSNHSYTPKTDLPPVPGVSASNRASNRASIGDLTSSKGDSSTLSPCDRDYQLLKT